MTADGDLAPIDPPHPAARLRPLDPVRPALAAATPARVFLGRVGTTLRTRDLLALRVDHAAARDAVHARLDDESGALEPLVVGHGMFTVTTQAHTPHAYLRRPDLGRLFSEEGAARIRAEGTRQPAVQLVVADGLSARAVGSYAPPFVEAFAQLADRSLISNIHDDGIPPGQAASDAAALVEQILATRASGVSSLLSAHDHKSLTDQ